MNSMGDDWRGSQAASRCPFLNPNADLNTIISHNALLCDRCRDEQILEKTKGEEILFIDNPPYWVLPSKDGESRDNEDSNESIASKDFTQRKITAARGSHVQGGKLENVGKLRKSVKEGEILDTPETSHKIGKSAKESGKREAKVPTNIALHKLTKQGYSKEEALQKYVEMQREKARPKSEDDKVQIDREDMPWAPSFPKILRKYRSVVQRPIDHQRYVAIVANFLNANHSQPRFQQNRQEVRVECLQIMDEKLKDERIQYQELVLHNLRSRKKPVYACSNQRAISYILDRLRSRALLLHCQYGAPIYDEEMKDLTVDALTSLTRKAILYHGKVPKITLPNERRRFMFNRSVEDISAQYPPTEETKYPLESDEFAMHLAVKYGVRVVMCSSSALKILCNPWIADHSTYLIPVVVKRSFSERTNRFENVCLVSKPCIEESINGPSIWRRYLKFSVKLAIHGDLKKADEKLSAKTGGRQRTNRAKLEQVNQIRQKADNENNLIIADEVPDVEQTSVNSLSDAVNRIESNSTQDMKITTMPSSSSAITPVCDDILGDIMNEMGTSNNDVTNSYRGMEHNSDPSSFNSADPNKRYTLFSLGHDGMQDVDLIIRASNDGMDGIGNELSIVHKVEYAAEFGAERVDDEEWLHDYFRCKLKCASQLVRLRIHYLEPYLLQRERYNENMLTANRPDLRKLAEERTQWLKKVVVKLESLQPGNYLIRKESNKLQILPPTDETNNLYLTEERLKQLYFDERLPPVEEIFRGIDEHLVLVYHIVQKRIPASFGAKKDDVVSRNPRKRQTNNARLPGKGQQAHRQQFKDIDDVFDPSKEATSAQEGISPSVIRSRRRRKRNRSRGNYRGGSRTSSGGKCSRFIDFDAPQTLQAL
uniref:NARG2_C domain-containing protein n=1 Tax=Elaeophora elaphi TaxID=1147741 RepID=A0A0R3RH47_9BILA